MIYDDIDREILEILNIFSKNSYEEILPELKLRLIFLT